MHKIIKQALLTTSLALCMANGAQASRYVVINGQRMNPRQLVAIDRMNCIRIPNGRYWFNFYTKAWGYEGNPYPQGRVGQACNRRRPRRRKSLSERGLLYSPGELFR